MGFYENEDDYIRSDFIIVNKMYAYILIVAVCINNNLSKAIKQLQETKKLLKSRYGAYLEKWRLMSTIYWERNGATKNLHVFLGKNDLEHKLKVIHHQKLSKVKKERFDWLFE